ncbi:putative reverse transcriptase domain-containing protein [Tanacetum coccineum]
MPRTLIPLRPNLGVLQIGIKSQGYREPDSVMSDSDESWISYTEVSSPFEGLSYIGSPRADNHEYLELPWMPKDPYVEAALQAPPSPDYVHGLEEPDHAPPSPDYVPCPEHADDEIVAEDQPDAEDASPTAQSPDYVPKSDPEADPEEDDDEDTEEDPIDYYANGGDDGDDEDESSKEDEDDEVDMDVDEDEEEEEHPALANSIVVALSATDQAPSAEKTEPFETDESAATPPPHPAYRVTARISILAPVPTPVWSQSSLGYQAALIRMRAEAASTSYSLPLPPPFILPPTRSDAPSSGILHLAFYQFLLHQHHWCSLWLVHLLWIDREIRRDPEREVGYGITDSWDEIVETLQGAPVSTDTELGRHMTAFETRVRQDTDEIYTRDRRAHAYTRHQMETEARLSREAWRRSMDASDLARGEVMSLRTTVLDHRRSAEMRELRTADRTRQQQLIQTLTVMQSLQGQVTTLQGQVTALQGQQGPAGGPAQPELPEEAAPTATTTTSVTNAQLQAMIDQGVTVALAARDANRNGDDSHTSGTGTEGVVELTQWFKRMEIVFCISNCPVENQVKFSTCTLLAGALTWWNSHVMTVSHDAAYAMTLADLRKKMTDKYCPRNEMKKLEAELWNLKVKGTDVIGYNQRFQELALLCVRMFLEESDKIERYVGGLPDMIHGNIVASNPKTMQEAVEMATELMDKKVITIAERQAENKRKFENTSRNNQNQQQQNKRQNTGRAYTVGTGEKKPYRRSKPLCAKCNYHHDGPCAPKCHKCNKVGHFARDYRSAGNANNANNQRGTGAPAKVYVVGHAGTNPDSNIVTGTFLLNNRYASILFDTGADRIFVSTAFSSQMDITLSTLDYYYDVELADGRIIRLNTILRGCTLNLLNHPFNINLMPVELGSFDAIIGMDWLAKYQAIIVCAKKIVRIPWGNETLIVHGDKSNQGHEARLHIILYSKT